MKEQPRDQAASPPRVSVSGARKSFGGIHALTGVDFDVATGEIHALVGENGAGKSTLMKILSGAHAADGGTLAIDGVPYAPRTPEDAREAGVAMIYQELNLCADLSVLENVTLGIESHRFGLRRDHDARLRLQSILAELGVSSFDGSTKANALGPADRQMVEISRALFAGARVLIFDEPTSSLGPLDARRLFDVVRRAATSGVAVIWISHFLDEVLALCSRYTILRDGASVDTGSLDGVTADRLAAMMVGRPLDAVFPERAPKQIGAIAFEALDVHDAGGVLHGASISVHAGEVVGIFGLVGAGRTEFLRAAIGLDKLRNGQVSVDGTRVPEPSPRVMAACGAALLSEDRSHEGIGLDLSIADNAALPSLESLASPSGRRSSPFRSVTRRMKAAALEPWRARLQLAPKHPQDAARTLSGGNQQKVAIARLLQQNARVLLLDEPTRGIDVGAKIEIYRLLDELSREGRAILMCSSYLPELFGTCDRIAVMRRGHLTDARPTHEWTLESAMAAATTETPHEAVRA